MQMFKKRHVVLIFTSAFSAGIGWMSYDLYHILLGEPCIFRVMHANDIWLVLFYFLKSVELQTIDNHCI